MLQLRVFCKYWLPVLLWMAVIFSASSDAFSSSRTSRIIGPLVRWLAPSISDDALYTIVTVVRKTAHMVEFGVLAALFWRAWRQARRRPPGSWQWSDAGAAVLFVALYAGSDELHQLFVPTRQAQIGDVLFDVGGAVAGLGVLWLRQPLVRKSRN